MQNSGHMTAMGNLAAAFAQGGGSCLSEDLAICFVDDKITRTCGVCGTVFKGSTWDLLAGRDAARCPYCHCPGGQTGAVC